MHIITGGTGHVGSALAKALLQKGEKITIVSRNSDKAQKWIKKGAGVAVADIYDTDGLHEIFKQGKTLFLLNPPADPMTNTDIQERKTVASLLKAVENTGVEKIVAESTLGAQPGKNIGDLGVLYELEQGVAKLSYPYSIIRPAYYMSNWDQALHTVLEKGKLMSFFPADLKFPMVAPGDIGELAARLLTEKDTALVRVPTNQPPDSPPHDPTCVFPIPGPDLYSPNDVANAFSKALGGKNVKVNVIPEDQWVNTFQSMGFSKEAAASYAGMTRISLHGGFEIPANTMKGATTLQQYIKSLVEGHIA